MKKNFYIYKNMLNGRVFAATNENMDSLDSNYRLLYTAVDGSTWYEKHEFLMPFDKEENEEKPTFKEVFKQRGWEAWEEDILDNELCMGDECELECELESAEYGEEGQDYDSHCSVRGEAVVMVTLHINTEDFEYSDDARLEFEYEAVRFSEQNSINQ